MKVTRGKLSAFQEHAAFLAASGHNATDWATASENAIENADTLARELSPGYSADSPHVSALTDEIRANHGDLLAKTKQAAQYLDHQGNATHPLVSEAVDAMRKAAASREDLRGMTADEVAHSVGSHWYGLERLLGGHNLHGELSDLIAQRKGNDWESPSYGAGGKPWGVERVGEKLDAAEREQQIHDLFTAKGHELIGKGSFHLPYEGQSKPILPSGSGALTRVASKFGIGPAKSSAVHAFEGKSLLRGDLKTKATTLSASSFDRAARESALATLHQKLLGFSKATKEEAGGERAVYIRADRQIPKALRDEVNKIHQGNLTPEEASSEAALKLWDSWVNEKPLSGEVRYLHPDTYAPFKPHQADAFLKSVDRVNQIMRAGRYLSPRYALWWFQNAAIGIPQQGVFLPANVVRYWSVVKNLKPETYDGIAHGMGEGASLALDSSRKGANAGIHTLASFWNKVDDHMWRMVSFVHEARREGFNTAQDLESLMSNPKLSDKRNAIFQRANNEAIDYGALTPAEKAYIKPLFVFWPWTRAASTYALRFPLEHPLQAAALADVGKEAKTRLGTVMNFLDYLNPFDTGGKLAQSLQQSAEGKWSPVIGQLPLGKPIQAALEYGTGYNNKGQKVLPGQAFSDILKSITPNWSLPKAPYEPSPESMAGGVDKANAWVQQSVATLGQVAAARHLSPKVVHTFTNALQQKGVYYAAMEQAAKSAGEYNGPSDTPSEVAKTLSYRRADLYYTATVSAMVKILNLTPANQTSVDEHGCQGDGQPAPEHSAAVRHPL